MKKNNYIFWGVIAVVIVAVLIVAYFITQTAPQTPQTQHVSVSSVSSAKETVAIQSVKPISNAAAASLVTAGAKTITWATAGFVPGGDVDINLIRKTSDSPVTYVFVRKIAQNIPNTGSATWIPQAGENTSDLYIEVTCSNDNTVSCQVTGNPIPAN